jgi:hypothetical protein
VNTADDKPQSARSKLAGFQEEVVPSGEYGMILLDACSIHLLEDDATPSAGLIEYQGQKSGSFFLKRGQAQILIAKLRRPEPPEAS